MTGYKKEVHYTEDGWRDQYDRRICTLDNETIGVVIDNCKEHLTRSDRIYVEDVVTLMEKALEGVADKKDLTPAEQMAMRNLRRMIKGL